MSGKQWRYIVIRLKSDTGRTIMFVHPDAKYAIYLDADGQPVDVRGFHIVRISRIGWQLLRIIRRLMQCKGAGSPTLFVLKDKL